MLGRELIFAIIGTGATCLATVLGASMVFFFKKDMSPVLQKIFLGFAAGAMIYVVVEELIPEAHLGEHTYAGTVSVLIGFVVMMVLDVALG